MKAFKRQSLIFATALSILMIGAIITLYAQKQKNKSNEENTDVKSQFPIVDFTKNEDPDPIKREKRQKKSKKYDKETLGINETWDVTSIFSSWSTRLEPLPVNKSTVIVIGQITDASAYLSNDKTGVYSEFIIKVDKVLKNNSQLSLASGDSLTAQRDGGRVRFPSGHITFVSIPGQGMPRLGKQYVLFLSNTFPERGVQDQDLYILTGYELRAGKIVPLDYQGSVHPLNTTYKDADESKLMDDLRAEIQSSQ